MKAYRKFIVILWVLLLISMFFHVNLLYSQKGDFIDISFLIKKFGYPGVVPCPQYIENYGSLKVGSLRIRDWSRPLSLTIGTRNILVILIDFLDKNATRTVEYFDDFIFGNSSGSLRDYYTEVSYGLLNVSGFIAGNRWYRSEHNMTWWGADSDDGIDDLNGYIFELAREAVEKADAEVDFSVFDVNNNKVIDPEELSLCIIHAGDDQAYSGVSTDIWSHFWYIFGRGYGYPDLIVDGCRISKHLDDNVGGYWMVAEFDPLGVYAHEFGHDLGLPDLYDVDGSSDGLGVWCLMSHGAWLGSPTGSCPSHLSAWCKIKLGWISPITVTEPLSNVLLPQIETNSVAYKLQASQNEYFLVVNRQKVGYDSYLPGSGILVWHIDESVGDNNNESHKLVDLEEAHGGVQNLDVKNDWNIGDVYDPFYSPHKSEFTDYTDPSCKAYNGSETRLWITNISDSGSIMTASFLQNLIPKASFTISPEPPYYAPLTLTFNASESTTLYGEIEEYKWDFNSDGIADAYGVIVNCTYNEAGNHTVTLNVTNTDGYWDAISINFTIDKRDIAILNVSVSDNEAYIGEVVIFKIKVANLGTVTETFNVTIYLNETIVRTLTINELPPANTTTLNVKWKVEEVSPGSYTIWAQASPVPYESNSENNSCVNGKIKIVKAFTENKGSESIRKTLR